jgi:hypothetical protein
MSRAAEDTLLKQLKNPFEPKFIKWRVGQTSKDKTKATALAYLDAREVMKRLDDVCGVGGWSDKIIEINNGFVCELSIKMPDGTWVTKSDAADQTDIEGIKGGASSALKRAAAVWGIGRYLYYLPRVWVAYEEKYKQLSVIPELPDWALPNRVERWEDVAEMELIADEPDTTTDTPAKKQELLNKLKGVSDENHTS